jgi:hypothetical protein
MKISEAILTFKCCNPECEEEIILDFGDVFDFSLLANRCRNELLAHNWKIFGRGREEFTFCSNQCLLEVKL